MKAAAVAFVLCIGTAAARKPSRETALTRIEKLLAARGGKKTTDRRLATAANSLKRKTLVATRRLSGDDGDDGGDDEFVPECPTPYEAWQDCIDVLYTAGTVTGDDDFFTGGGDEEEGNIGDDDDSCGTPSTCADVELYFYGQCTPISRRGPPLAATRSIRRGRSVNSQVKFYSNLA